MISNEHKTVFIHNPKCAGSSVKTALKSNKGSWIHGDWHYTLKQLKDKSPSISDYYKFSIVRNPYDRFVSAFTYNIEKVMDPGDYHWASYPLSYLVLRSFTDKHFASQTSWGGSDLIRTFRAFLQSPQSFRIFDKGWPIHFKPQCYFFKYADLNTVCRYEALMSEDCLIQKVEKDTGLTINIPHTNMSGHPDYKEFYDVKTMDRIKKLYRDDFLQLGYNIDMLGGKV